MKAVVFCFFHLRSSQQSGKNYDANKTDAEKGITIEISNDKYTLVKE